MNNFKKLTLGALFLMFSGNVFAQKYVTKSGKTSFFSATPMENISALNNSCTSIIDANTNQIAVKMQMTEFKFPNHLMEEHFNENYAESAKYPTATFLGKINEKIDFAKNGSYAVTATGALTVHGVKQDRTLKGTLVVNGNKIRLTTAYDLKLANHKIEIPTIVMAKIAESIAVKSDFEFTKQ